jgi:pyruvate kinase
LGVLEANVMASLNAVLSVLAKLTDQDLKSAHDPPADFRTGPLLLQDHTRSLLGPQPYNRSVHIMVTMPDAAATDPQLIQDLLAAGMDIMRINCAHGNPDEWAAIVDNLRKAEKTVGRSCKVQEEILWLCEAAHVPVIWATQMLEGLAKKGSPSRAEVTDAAMSQRAECAMLNKGPHIIETVNFLNGVLTRMATHQYKRKAMLRRLSVSRIDWSIQH